jgi:hypothetical protein
VAIVALAGAQTASAGQVIGQLSCPSDLSLDGHVNIVSARIEQERGLLTFVIETRGDIPAALARPEDSLTYLWLVDADNNPATGQVSPGFGSEFNIRAVVGELHGGGFVDGVGSMPGGGWGTISVQGNRVQITVRLEQIANPERLSWRCDVIPWVNGSRVPGSGLTEIATAEPLPFTPSTHVTVTTPLLMRRDGGRLGPRHRALGSGAVQRHTLGRGLR